MSSKSLSPAANLLRNSRLMAMPAPIAPPPSHTTFAPRSSPYPTLQAITTPRSSAHRGDWGLKRDLPLKTSQKTIFMRYEDLDTIEHMTTFESAHDDVYTLKKWQEMDIAIVKDSGFDSYIMDREFSHKSTVFDSEVKPEGYKWRYDGPFLDGMGEQELRDYIKKSILPRKAKFYEYVAKRRNLDSVRRDAADKGLKLSEEEMQAKAAAMPVQSVDILALRANLPYLEKLAVDFLDIPLGKPHMTHPSAGLHYTRSNAHAHNDPELGPQEARKEIPGRPLNYQATTGSLVGVGGVVAKVFKLYGQMSSDDRFAVSKYRVTKASIDSRGKIMMEIEQAAQPRERPGPLSPYTTHYLDRKRLQSDEWRDGADDLLNLLSTGASGATPKYRGVKSGMRDRLVQ